jgi:tyrosinase
MGFLEAPADPIFFSHHATLDLLHAIYYKCLVGSEVPLPIEVQLDDPRIFSSCARRESLGLNLPDSDVLMPQSSVMLRSGEEGRFPDSVFDPLNELAPFFAGLPTEYVGLADIRNLGAFSYNYQLTGLLADLFTTCAGSTLMSNLGGGQPPFVRHLEATDTKKTHNGWVEAVIVPSNHSSEWYAEALAAAVGAANASSSGQKLVQAMEDVEKMTCLFYDECRGGVRGFSDRFRQNFELSGESTCKTVVDDISAGRDSIRTPGWRGIFDRHLGCEPGHSK